LDLFFISGLLPLPETINAPELFKDVPVIDVPDIEPHVNGIDVGIAKADGNTENNLIGTADVPLVVKL
jgi:hypothetical protein